MKLVHLLEMIDKRADSLCQNFSSLLSLNFENVEIFQIVGLLVAF